MNILSIVKNLKPIDTSGLPTLLKGGGWVHLKNSTLLYEIPRLKSVT